MVPTELGPGLWSTQPNSSLKTRSQGNLVAVLLASEIVNDFGSLLSHLNQQNIIKNQQNNVAGRPRIGDDRYMDTRTLSSWMDEMDEVAETETDRWHREQVQATQARRDEIESRTGRQVVDNIDLDTYSESDDGMGEYSADEIGTEE